MRSISCATTVRRTRLPNAASRRSEEDDRTLVELLIEQIEFCDVLVVNKADLVSADELTRLQRILARINPRAVQVVSRFGDVPLDEVLDTGRFDFDEASSAPGWLAALNHEHDTSTAMRTTAKRTNSASAISFTGRAGRFIRNGCGRCCTRNGRASCAARGFSGSLRATISRGTLSQAGGACRHGPAGMWWAAQDRSEWPEGDDELAAEIAADWHGDPNDLSIGDRRQELVMIGIGIDPAVWQAKFDACLLTDDEYAQGPKAWRAVRRSFPGLGLRRSTTTIIMTTITTVMAMVKSGTVTTERPSHPRTGSSRDARRGSIPYTKPRRKKPAVGGCQLPGSSLLSAC